MNATTIGAAMPRAKPSLPDPTLDDFKIGGMTPFLASGSKIYLEEAVCLLTTLESAFAVLDAVSETDGDPLANMRPGILSTALSGIGNLIALGQYLREVEDHRRAQK